MRREARQQLPAEASAAPSPHVSVAAPPRRGAPGTRRSRLNHSASSDVDQSARATSRRLRVLDRVPDREGNTATPAYVEIVSASTRIIGRELRLRLRLQGKLPTAVRDDKHILMMGFNVWDERRREFAFSAILDENGWVTSIEERNSRKLKGRSVIGRQVIRFAVRLSQLDRPESLTWVAGTALTINPSAPKLLGHDIAPNEDEATQRVP